MVSSNNEASCESSQGLTFAQRQLEKHGWTKGKGLGKDESGTTDAIKVGVKNDTLGVGYDVGKEYTCHWWDHMFNKAASNIVVEQSESGIQVLKKDTSVADVSRRKKFWRVKGEQLYYGRFVKAKNEGDETVKQETGDNPDVITKFSDKELLKACGGRTAHKSARHGHKLSGKLQRIAEQETTSCYSPENNPNEAALKLDDSRHDEECLAKRKKKKKKRRKEAKDDMEKNLKTTTDTSGEANPLGNTGDSGICGVSNEDPTGLDRAQRRTSSSDVGKNCKRKRKDKKKIKENKASQKKEDKSWEKKRKRLKQV